MLVIFSTCIIVHCPCNENVQSFVSSNRYPLKISAVICFLLARFLAIYCSSCKVSGIKVCIVQIIC